MAYVIGCLMAGLSFLLNKVLIQYIGIKAVISYSPLVEEITKTFCSYYLAADILITHVVFGILEAAYDWYCDQLGRGLYAALCSVLGHTVFGASTLLILHMSGSVVLAILVASCIHLVWNVTMIRLSS